MIVMRIVTQRTFGEPSVLELSEAPKPVPAAGQVLIKVGAAGINPIDLLTRAGEIPLLGEPPFTVGWDVAGVVEEIGEGVEHLQPGDEVLGLVSFPRAAGGYAEYVVADTKDVVRKPDALTTEEAAGLPMVALTAWQALVGIADVRAGQRVLVHRAAGGVGHLAVQIAKARGAHVIGTASAPKHEFLRGLGADELIDYRTRDFTEIEPVDVVFDLVGGEDYAQRSARIIRPGGILVSALPPNPGITEEQAAALGIRFGIVSVTPDPDDLAQVIGFKVHVEHVLPLAEAVKAHELVASGATTGKVVLVP